MLFNVPRLFWVAIHPNQLSESEASATIAKLQVVIPQLEQDDRDGRRYSRLDEFAKAHPHLELSNHLRETSHIIHGEQGLALIYYHNQFVSKHDAIVYVGNLDDLRGLSRGYVEMDTPNHWGYFRRPDKLFENRVREIICER
jgi:hypothetical protein